MRFSAASVLAALVTILGLSLMSACGGSGANPNTVTQIVLTPTALSMNEGDVATLSAVAENSTGGVVAADINFTTSNGAIATVSSGGLVCAGVWDANIINCNTTMGPSGVGVVTITATAATNTSVTSTLTAYVHEHVDRVTINGPSDCTSMGQFSTAVVAALSTTAPGCSTVSPCNITSTVGPITYGETDPSILTINTTGIITALKPGPTAIFASVSGVNSDCYPLRHLSRVHYIAVQGTSNSGTAFTLNPTATFGLTASVYDTHGQFIGPPITWGSNSNAVATVLEASTGNPNSTVTAVAAGTASITATCSSPDCNVNLPPQYSKNVVTITVTGNTSTTVYAGNTNSTSLIPIATDSNAAGTAITLPAVPNSIVAAPDGSTIYLGSSTSLMIVATAGNTVTTAAVPGQVLAVSDDGSFVLVSNPSTNTVYVYDITSTSTASTTTALTSSGVFTPDSKSALFTSGTSVFSGGVNGAAGPYSVPYTATAVGLDAQGALTYVTSSSNHSIDVRSTCFGSSDLQLLSANSPTLVSTVPSGSGVVAADSPNLDVVTSAIVPPNVILGCPVPASNTIASYDLGVGAFTAQQMFVSPDSSRVWLISNLPEVISFNLTNLTPTAIPFANGATPLSGGIRSDGQQVYIGASDGTVHRIDVASNTDAQQITVGLKDSSGNAVTPNLVAVAP